MTGRVALLLAMAMVVFGFLAASTEKPFPIYVTIVMHNEDPPTNPDFTQDRETYIWSRTQLLKFASLLQEYGAAFDWQSEWCFLTAVRMYDQGDVVADTEGKNIVRWLHDLGVSIDPHSHERHYNYADVAELIRRLGVEPSRVVGGFLYWPPDNRQGWEKFQTPLRGNVFPDAVWEAEILWGAGTAGHKGPDLFASGVWRPKDRYHFVTHDPDQLLIYIGSYKRAAMQMGGLPELVRLAQEGELDPDGLYTVTIFVPQMMLTDEFITRLEEQVLRPIQGMEQEGLVRWATLPEIAEIWKAEFRECPTIFIPEDQRELIRSLFPS